MVPKYILLFTGFMTQALKQIKEFCRKVLLEKRQKHNAGFKAIKFHVKLRSKEPETRKTVFTSANLFTR